MRKTLSILWPSLLFGSLGGAMFSSLLDPVGITAASSRFTYIIEHRDASR